MIERIYKDLKTFLGKDRYRHTMGVVEEAEKLSAVYGADSERAVLASLLHDIGKSKQADKLLKVEDASDIILKENLDRNRAIYHSVASKRIATSRYGIGDEDVLNAIRYHTTGRAGMSDLEKIVYLADYIEPGRDFEGVERMRELSYRSLDDAMLFALENTIRYVVSRGLILHENTVRARNYLIAQSIKIGVER